MSKIESWAEDFDFLDDDEKLETLIDYAKKAGSMPDLLKTNDNLVKGCISQIWVAAGVDNNSVVSVYYDSDAIITKGIAHVVADCFTGISLDKAKAITKEDFKVLGIDSLLSTNRRNGLSSLIDTVIAKVNNL